MPLVSLICLIGFRRFRDFFWCSGGSGFRLALQHCCRSLGCDQDDHGMTRRHQEVVTGSRVLPSTPLMPLKTNCDMVTAAFFGHQPIY